MKDHLISNTQCANLLGFTRQHFESFKAKFPGFPEPSAMERPRVHRADGGWHLGTPYPMFKKSEVMKWITDNDIKRTRNVDADTSRSTTFDNDLAQLFIRAADCIRPRMATCGCIISSVRTEGEWGIGI
jgi:hypothetical protein